MILLSRIRAVFRPPESGNSVQISVRNIEQLRRFGKTEGNPIWHEYGSGYGTMANCDYSPKTIDIRSTFVPRGEPLCEQCEKLMLEESSNAKS